MFLTAATAPFIEPEDGATGYGLTGYGIDGYGD